MQYDVPVESEEDFRIAGFFLTCPMLNVCDPHVAEFTSQVFNDMLHYLQNLARTKVTFFCHS